MKEGKRGDEKEWKDKGREGQGEEKKTVGLGSGLGLGDRVTGDGERER